LSTAPGLDPRAGESAELRAWIALQLALALSPRQACQALSACGGDPAAALRHCERRRAPGPGAVRRARAALVRARARLLPFGSPAYPWRLSQLRDPAPVLWVIGCVEALAAPAVAIVGSRAASAYGLRTAERLAGELADAGLVVVSGLARGIDAAAHSGALEAGGRTVAVQACGPDRVYPSAHRALAERIAERGAVIGELPPGTRPLPAHFPLRNRLISGLCRALLVVEARERSGSLITARHALDQGADVFAVPGPIDVPTSRGPNRLLRDGAWPVLESADVLDVLGGWRAVPADHRSEPGCPGDAELLATLARAPASLDELAVALARPPESLAPELLELEVEGRIARDRDGRFRAVS
jgi:DNA processing protein